MDMISLKMYIHTINVPKKYFNSFYDYFNYDYYGNSR